MVKTNYQEFMDDVEPTEVPGNIISGEEPPLPISSQPAHPLTNIENKQSNL